MSKEFGQTDKKTLPAFALRDAEISARHFAQMVEINRLHNDARALHEARTDKVNDALAMTERKNLDLSKKLARQNEELKEAQASIETLKKSLRKKAHSHARLDRQLMQSIDRIAQLENLLEMERQQHRSAVFALQSNMEQGFISRNQWLFQAIYLLRLASDYLTMKSGWLSNRYSPRHKDCLALAHYISQWRAELSAHLDGLESQRDSGARAHSLQALLALHDRDFVRSAFLTLLHREPDEAGEVYYLYRLREGAAKIGLLGQIRNSDEGKTVDPGIAGLDRAIKRYRLGTLPFVGKALRAILRTEGDGMMDRKVRAYENALAIAGTRGIASNKDPIGAHLYL